MQLKRSKHLHSKEHVLADDLSQAMREPKKFAAYLGIAKLYHESDLRRLMRYVLEKENLPPDARGKYFFASLKGLDKKPGVKFKRKARIQKKSGKPRAKQEYNNGKHSQHRKRAK